MIRLKIRILLLTRGLLLLSFCQPLRKALFKLLFFRRPHGLAIQTIELNFLFFKLLQFSSLKLCGQNIGKYETVFLLTCHKTKGLVKYFEAKNGGEFNLRKTFKKYKYYYEDDHEELYNLKADLSETTDVSAQNPEIVQQMHAELFDYLKNVGAKFPKKDPEYNIQAEKQYEQDIIDKLWPRLEKQRKEMLSPEFKPNKDWWGSQFTKD